MSDRQFLDYDPLTGVTEYYIPRENGRFAIQSEQDETPLLERNKALQNRDDGYSPSRELRRAASIPTVVIDMWRARYGIDVFNKNHWPAVKRLLNSSEWRYLRTAPGVL